MLYGRRLDQALEHVDGSRYALVHAVAKRARQITLWLTADPAELRAEAAPPPAAGELVTRDPVALSEAEILAGEVRVRWNPDGEAEEREEIAPTPDLEDDTLLLEGLGDEDEDVELGGDDDAGLTPALAQVLEGEPGAEEEADEAEEAEEAEEEPEDDLVSVSLDDLADQEAAEDDEEEEAL